MVFFISPKSLEMRAWILMSPGDNYKEYDK